MASDPTPQVCFLIKLAWSSFNIHSPANIYKQEAIIGTKLASVNISSEVLVPAPL
jgi:hypothetical protein